MADGLEFERKWLVEQPPDVVRSAPGESIEQGYLAVGEDGNEVRLRRRAGRCFLTVKSGRGLVRQELEIEISVEQFESLWPATEGRRVVKSRRVIDLSPAPHGQLRIELDEYGGKLSGLWVAEVEFPDQGTARSFKAPVWFGDDVTERDGYKNRNLATRGQPAGEG